MGRNWIDVGLPPYMALDRKLENRRGIQNAVFVQCGVMLRLKEVKGAIEEESAIAAAQNEKGMLHGAKVCKYLVQLKLFQTELFLMTDTLLQ